METETAAVGVVAADLLMQPLESMGAMQPLIHQDLGEALGLVEEGAVELEATLPRVTGVMEGLDSEEEAPHKI